VLRVSQSIATLLVWLVVSLKILGRGSGGGDIEAFTTPEKHSEDYNRRSKICTVHLIAPTSGEPSLTKEAFSRIGKYFRGTGGNLGIKEKARRSGTAVLQHFGFDVP